MTSDAVSDENVNITIFPFQWLYTLWHNGVLRIMQPTISNAQGPVLLLRHDAVARILANGRAAFFESCGAIGWKDSVRSM